MSEARPLPVRQLPARATRRARARLAPLAALALALASACSSTPDEPKRDPQKEFELYKTTAVFHYANKEYARAHAQAQKALEIEPHDQKLLLMKAWIRLQAGTTQDYLAAEKQFRALLSEGGYEAQLGLAATLERLGTVYRESADALEQSASGAQPQSDGTLSAARAPDKKQRARIEELRAKRESAWRESVAIYARMLQERPADLAALNGSQRTLGLLGEFAASLQHTDRLVEAAQAERSFWQGQLQREVLTADEETSFRKRVDDSRALEVGTRLYAASALRALGRMQECVDQLARVIELEPSLPEAYSRRAQGLHALGRHEEALADLDVYLRLTPRPYEDPDVRAAYELRSQCAAALAHGASAASSPSSASAVR
jgi:tetratricopeptide (TPR) repeat protein